MTAAQPKHRFRITFHENDDLPSPYIEFNSSAVDLMSLHGDVVFAVHRHLSPFVGRAVEVTMAEPERGIVTVGGVRLCRISVLRLVRIVLRSSKPACEFVEGDLLMHLDVNEWVVIRVLGVDRGEVAESGMILLHTEAGAFRCGADEELRFGREDW